MSTIGNGYECPNLQNRKSLRRECGAERWMNLRASLASTCQSHGQSPAPQFCSLCHRLLRATLSQPTRGIFYLLIPKNSCDFSFSYSRGLCLFQKAFDSLMFYLEWQYTSLCYVEAFHQSYFLCISPHQDMALYLQFCEVRACVLIFPTFLGKIFMQQVAGPGSSGYSDAASGSESASQVFLGKYGPRTYMSFTQPLIQRENFSVTFLKNESFLFAFIS